MIDVNELGKDELHQQIRLLQARLAVVNNSNEELQLQVDESDHCLYDRGPIQEEIDDLRKLNTQHLTELERMRRENNRLKDSVRRAAAIVPEAGRRHQRHAFGHPED